MHVDIAVRDPAVRPAARARAANRHAARGPAAARPGWPAAGIAADGTSLGHTARCTSGGTGVDDIDSGKQADDSAGRRLLVSLSPCLPALLRAPYQSSPAPRRRRPFRPRCHASAPRGPPGRWESSPSPCPSSRRPAADRRALPRPAARARRRSPPRRRLRPRSGSLKTTLCIWMSRFRIAEYRVDVRNWNCRLDVHAASTVRIAPAIRSRLGMYCHSCACGNGVSQPVTRTIGASRLQKQCCCTSATTSAPKPHVRGASCTTMQRPVFSTER